jgi:mannose-1-phosphate guanylyltransferase / mannose-6-phosphate isomerase
MSSSSYRPLIGLILSGGGGTRLWPMSQEARPKQFLRLFGADTLFQTTWRRLKSVGIEEAVVLTNVALESLAAADIAEMGVSDARFVLEPSRRDSGPAVAAGVAAIRARHGDDALVLIAASDHLIPDVEAYGRSIAKAKRLAEAGYLVTFGIKPTHPATEYGYLQRGPAVAGVPEGYRVEKFHEKPAIDRATAYVADPDFSWNSGMFLFRVGTFAEEAAAHMPEIWRAASEAVAKGTDDGNRLLLDQASFDSAQRISIDFALMERSSRVGMVPADFGWSDIGGWAAVLAESDQDAAGNAMRGAVVARDCAHSLIIGDGLPVLAVGLEGFTVVATRDGVFIAPKSRTAEIKPMLDSLKAL